MQNQSDMQHDEMVHLPLNCMLATKPYLR